MVTTIIHKETPAEKAPKQFLGVGKRKTSIARVFVTPGSGAVSVNGREEAAYFPREVLQKIIHQPLEVTGSEGKFDIRANIRGGGLSGQAEALKFGIAKALLIINPDFRKPLKTSGFLTRDARIVERKKYGRHKARRRPQFSKR